MPKASGWDASTRFEQCALIKLLVAAVCEMTIQLWMRTTRSRCPHCLFLPLQCAGGGRNRASRHS
jgi:hypothetical protein